MKKHTVKVEMSIKKGRLPLLAAFCLFIIAIVCLCLYLNSPHKQAGQIIKGLYTADDSWSFETDNEDGLSELYWERFGPLTTMEGLNSARRLRLPCGLLEKGRKVVKTYASLPELLQEETEPESESGSEKDISYAYRIQVEFYYDKGDEVMQPVETEEYGGVVTMKKIGLLKWRLDGITGERIR